MDIFDKCYNFTIAKEVMKTGNYPYFLAMSGTEGTFAEYRGKKLIMCGSNNYLGLTTHPDVRKAAMDAVDRYGTSCTGSRFLNGTLELHEQLEKELADWVGKDSALVFSTGMQVNLGTISALVCRQDTVVLDKDDHASIVDGARLSWGDIERFKHSDVEDLDHVLAGIPDTKGKMVVVDGVFSMEGDIAPLPAIVEVCKKRGARFMVDDAHAIGVLGGGKGSAAHFGLTKEVDLIMGTFSKSLASVGGFIAGDEDIIHYIKHSARSFIFSASISPANTAAALAALQVMRREPERVQKVNQIGDYVRQALKGMGFNTGRSTTPIIPIFIGDTNLTFKAWKMLFEAGIFVNATISPAVPEGKEMLRASFMATHTEKQISQFLKSVEAVGKQVGLIK